MINEATAAPTPRVRDLSPISNEPWWTTLSASSLLELRQRLLRYVRAAFGHILAADIEDIVQQAFVALYRQREKVNAKDDGLFRFLKTTARNLSLDHMRKARRRRKHFDQIVSSSPDPSEWDAVSPLEFAEEKDRIWEVFCALSELERLVLWSYAVEGKSVRAIARDLDLNWHRVAVMLYKALRQMRKSLEA
ncbi:MAG: sigma-70 family RNA polymerase sigma factor [Phycisphaerales bacterium]|nr:MAG: sigma-70 family RNA polymerase sigma factor [Phycisphaerales bacterium]